MENNWVKVLETIRDDEGLEYLKQEFEKNNIEHKIEIEEKWEGSIRNPKYIANFVIYIQEKYKDEAEKIIDSYYEIDENINLENNNNQDLNVDEEDEIESQKIAKKQKKSIMIYMGIVICMAISILVASIAL